MKAFTYIFIALLVILVGSAIINVASVDEITQRVMNFTLGFAVGWYLTDLYLSTEEWKDEN